MNEDIMDLEIVDLPPWAQTGLTLLGVVVVLLPFVARTLEPYAPRWADRLRVLGVGLRGLLPERYVPRVLPAPAEAATPLPGKPPTPPTITVLALPFAVAALGYAVAGCRPHEALDAGAEVGRSTGVMLRTVCTEPYERAAELSPQLAATEVAQLDALGCPKAARAHDALRAAHSALSAAVAANSGELELARASAKMTEAAYALDEALDALRRGAK